MTCGVAVGSAFGLVSALALDDPAADVLGETYRSLTEVPPESRPEVLAEAAGLACSALADVAGEGAVAGWLRRPGLCLDLADGLSASVTQTVTAVSWLAAWAAGDRYIPDGDHATYLVVAAVLAAEALADWSEPEPA